MVLHSFICTIQLTLGSCLYAVLVCWCNRNGSNLLLIETQQNRYTNYDNKRVATGEKHVDAFVAFLANSVQQYNCYMCACVQGAILNIIDTDFYIDEH